MAVRGISRASVDRLDRFGLVVLSTLGFALGLGYALVGVRPIDADHYWVAAHSSSFYGLVWGADAASFYVYPPPLAQALRVIPWSPFVVTWTTLLFIGFWAATRWWSLPVFAVSAGAVVLFGFGHVLADPIALTVIGNPQVLVAAAIVTGFRWPAAWFFPVLTKIAPGIGLLWFAVRREWRSLGVALGATIAVAAVSFAIAPGAWGDFARFASTNSAAASPEPTVPVPFIVRVAMSVALIVWGARTNRGWTVPIAVGWSAIALYESSYVTIWIAALPLLTAGRDRAPGEAGSTPSAGGRP